MHHTIKEKAILIISYQDDITVAEARAYFEEYYCPKHEHPHTFGNYKMCDGCRVDDAMQLSLIINED